jgi:hypothetical protein
VPPPTHPTARETTVCRGRPPTYRHKRKKNHMRPMTWHRHQGQGCTRTRTDPTPAGGSANVSAAVSAHPHERDEHTGTHVDVHRHTPAHMASACGYTHRAAHVRLERTPSGAQMRMEASAEHVTMRVSWYRVMMSCTAAKCACGQCTRQSPATQDTVRGRGARERLSLSLSVRVMVACGPVWTSNTLKPAPMAARR